MTKKATLSLLIFCMVLIAAMALTGCGNKDAAAMESTAYEDGATIGEGSVAFPFTVTDSEGTESSFTVLTDKTTVGEALLDTGIIAGEDGDYGLYVKSVNGIAADFEADGAYWAFYIDGEYAMSGVDVTEITPGAAYAMKVEK